MAEALVSLESVTFAVLLTTLVALAAVVYVTPLWAFHTVRPVSHDYLPEVVKVFDTASLSNQLLHDHLK